MQSRFMTLHVAIARGEMVPCEVTSHTLARTSESDFITKFEDEKKKQKFAIKKYTG